MLKNALALISGSLSRAGGWLWGRARLLGLRRWVALALTLALAGGVVSGVWAWQQRLGSLPTVTTLENNQPPLVSAGVPSVVAAVSGSATAPADLLPGEGPGSGEEPTQPAPRAGAEGEEEPLAAEVADLAAMVWPVSGRVIAGLAFGFDPAYGDYRLHPGVDIEAPAGTQVRAALKGVVDQVTQDQQHGRQVVLDHGNGWQTRYTQLGQVKVREGQQVLRGEVLGQVAPPALAEAGAPDHLHFEVRYQGEPQNPLEYLPFMEVAGGK